MVNKCKSKTNGITLVALIITIIILLILVGVTIGTLGGNNGLFAKAKLSKEKYEISKAKEKIELEIANLQIEQQTKGYELTKEILPKMNNDEIDVRDTTNFPVEVICGDYKFEIDENFKVKYVGEVNETIITYTTEPCGYTNQNKVKILVKISNPKGIKSIKKPGEENEEVIKNQTKIETEFSVNKNGHYILEVTDTEDKKISKDIYIDLIDILAPKDFTPEVRKNGNSITIIENGEDADATDESTKSGIDYYEYYVVDSNNKETKYETNKIENLATGTYKLYLIAFDRAGNSTRSKEKEFTITIEFSKIATTIEGGHCLAIDKDNNLFSWGGSISYELEDGETTIMSFLNSWGPVKMKLDLKVKEMSVGSWSHSLVIDNNGNLWSRENYENSYGQLGNGTTDISKKLIKIKEDTKFKKVSASTYHNLAIDNEGNLWSWGFNAYGQLGDGTKIDKTSPVLVKTGTKFIQISAGEYHNLAIDSDGNLWAWGRNNYGQLGIGGTIDQTSIVQVKQGTKFTQISTGMDHSLAIDSEGNLFAWGYNKLGQLGDGTTTNKTSPVLVKTDKKFTKISGS